jgi:hypothetical protein
VTRWLDIQSISRAILNLVVCLRPGNGEFSAPPKAQTTYGIFVGWAYSPTVFFSEIRPLVGEYAHPTKADNIMRRVCEDNGGRVRPPYESGDELITYPS